MAARPPLAVAEGLRERVTELNLPAHRLVPACQIHVTLHFLGPVPVRELDDIRESVRRSAAGVAVAQTCAEALRTLPKRAPRLVAAVLSESPPLLEVHRRLVQRLARRPRADSRFLPHLTICRFRSGERCDEIDVPIDGSPFQLERIELMRSTLLPEGARYETLETVQLGA